MKIFIPSRDRAKRLADGLLQQLPVNRLSDVHVLVPDAQFETYAKYINPDSGIGILGMDDNMRIAAKREFIGDFAATNGFEQFLMLDDDIQFLIRRGPDNWQLQEADKSNVDALISYMEDRFDHNPNVSHIGVSGREGNNRCGVGFPGSLDVLNTRTMRAVAWRTRLFVRLEHQRVDVMEDFDLSIQALKRGTDNLCINYWAQGQRSTQDAGGCSVWRTRAIHDASATRLAELHPGVVRTRVKKNLTGALAERLEVTVQWKEAAKIGKANAK